MRILRIAARIIVGSVFIFSGIVKAIDPLGSAYKFHDYFQAFNIGFLNSLSLTLSVLLCTSEFITGLSLLTGWRQKTGIWGALLLMGIFTPLTFILALTNPVSDCGCFGDAIHLTNWQTFEKNLVLFVIVLFLFFERKKTIPVFRPLPEWILILSSVILFVLFSLANLRYLPLIDFLPYKTGVKIADKMVVPAGVAVDEYQTTFIYEKKGEKKEFTLSNYPADDTTWKFVDQKSVLIKKGYQPPIHDFIITSMSGEDVTNKLLSHKGYSVLMICKKLGEAGQLRLTKGFELGNYCIEKGIDFYILTSSGTDEARSYMNGLNFYSADETTLKTMIRSNPGYILIKDGIITGKWSWANLPQIEKFEKLLFVNN